jgi:hypothetical protein
VVSPIIFRGLSKVSGSIVFGGTYGTKPDVSIFARCIERFVPELNAPDPSLLEFSGYPTTKHATSLRKVSKGAYGRISLSNNLTILSAVLRPLSGFVPDTRRPDVTE